MKKILRSGISKTLTNRNCCFRNDKVVFLKDDFDIFSVKSNETPYAYMKIENSIFIFVYKPQELLNAEIANICIEDRFKYCEYEPYPVLADIRQVKSFTKEARDLLATKGTDLLSAAAILVKSPVQRMITNFYIEVNKPKKPTRMFTDEKKALKWLSKYVIDSGDESGKRVEALSLII
ncbi:MAG: hypothetical protein AAGF85_10895 [Bacteroidota bacterium]